MDGTQTIQTTQTDKPAITICSACQLINKPQAETYAVNVSPEIKREMDLVNYQVEANRGNYRFSHSSCLPHMEASMHEIGMDDAKIKATLERYKNTAPPCLLTDNALRHAYMRGLFTKEQIMAAAQEMQQQNHALVERFQTLSGIKSVYAN